VDNINQRKRDHTKEELDEAVARGVLCAACRVYGRAYPHHGCPPSLFPPDFDEGGEA
jgi:hypothetical protein